MPTKRTRRKRGKIGIVHSATWYFLNDELHGEIREQSNPFEVLELETSSWPHRELSLLWDEHRDAVLKRWLLLHPGTRPHCWWLLDAPALARDKAREYAGTYFHESLKEPRKQLAGIGSPLHEHFNVSPMYRYGVPALWVDQNTLDSYKHRQLDCVVIDPDNPPIFESQASYLDRFDLLSAAEKRKSDFEPESLFDAIGDFYWPV